MSLFKQRIDILGSFSEALLTLMMKETMHGKRVRMPLQHINSAESSAHKHLKDYNKVLHGEHIIPLSMVFKRWLELIDEGVSAEQQRDFLEHHLEVVWITVAEQQKLDRELKLKSKMPEGWTWNDSKYARLNHADIVLDYSPHRTTDTITKPRKPMFE